MEVGPSLHGDGRSLDRIRELRLHIESEISPAQPSGEQFYSWAALGEAQFDQDFVTSTQVVDINGQKVRQTGPGSDQRYTYDSRRRLNGTADVDVATGACTTRVYGLDVRSNRTSKSTRVGATAGVCPSSAQAPSSTVSHVLDSADRAQDAGMRYDAFGRITNLPASAGELVNGFHVNDLVASQTQGDQRQTWNLDPAMRFRTYRSERLVSGSWTNAVTKVNHYGDGTDEPRWITEDARLPDSLTRYVASPDGMLVATTGKAGNTTLQMTNLHGDVMATVPLTTSAPFWGAVTVHDSDEFGNPRTTAAAAARYSWLGAHQRSQDGLADTILMGARLYHHSTGRFLSVDPEPGGSATAYDYGGADPVNTLDLDGKAFFIPLLIIAGRLAVQACIRYCAQAIRAVSARARAIPRATRRPTPRAASCRVNSFTPETLVLMADGSRRQINDMAIGDLVAATDPETGAVRSEPVLDVIVGYGAKHLIRLDADATRPGVLLATADHPIWVQGRGWVPAADVTVHDRVRPGSDATWAAIDDLGFAEQQVVFNLSVGGTHTFTVIADNVQVLSHNCPSRRGDNKMGPDGRARGYAHTTIRWGRDGRIEHYQTWRPNARQSSGFESGVRFRGTGRMHGGLRPPLIYPRGSGKAMPAPRHLRPRGY